MIFGDGWDMQYSCNEIVLTLDNDEKMIFVDMDILTSSIHPANIQPIKNFIRHQIPEKVRKEIFEKCNYQCELKLDGECTGKATEIDHIVPIKKGGGDDPYNLQGSCMHCNRVKSDSV